VILSGESHIVDHQAGAAAVLSSVQLRVVRPAGPEKPWITWEQIEPRIRKDDDIHSPPTGCIALENALAYGRVQPLESVEAVRAGARDYGLPIHLDGARIFNAALALGVDASEVAARTDSVMFCLSKGLCSPVGSLLVGDADFIDRARRKRKIMGGGMRQAGVLAAPGIISLTTMRERLSEDHETAREFARILSGYVRFSLEPAEPEINMVFCRVLDETGTPSAEKAARFVELLARHAVLTYPPFDGLIRFVTHHGIGMEEMGYIDSIMPEVVVGLG
jgi:threonine aldolase